MRSVALIAVDWGTSSCRAYLIDATGSVLDRRDSPDGVLAVARRARAEGVSRPDAFERALRSLCGDWLPGKLVVAAGMVGSSQGLAEAPYRSVPVDLLDVPPLTRVEAGDLAVHIVPGLLQEGPVPGVLRGEETQILGTLLEDAQTAPEDEKLLVLPGTHSKWARVAGTVLTEFATAMTGELYTLLRTHSVLGLEAGDGEAWEAFDRGVDMAMTHRSGGLPGTLFSARSLLLTGGLEAAEVPDYLSGLLIGSEIDAMLGGWFHGAWAGDVEIVGERALSARYARALAHRGTPSTPRCGDAAPRALAYIARAAGLLDAPTPARHPSTRTGGRT